MTTTGLSLASPTASSGAPASSRLGFGSLTAQAARQNNDKNGGMKPRRFMAGPPGETPQDPRPSSGGLGGLLAAANGLEDDILGRNIPKTAAVADIHGADLIDDIEAFD